MARLLAIVLVVYGFALAAPLPADAAMALRITVDPVSPRVGQVARVTVVTLAPFSSHCVDDPRADMRPWWDWHPDAPHFDLKAFRNDRVLDIPLTRRDPQSAYWDGLVAFPEQGGWDIRMVQPMWSGGNSEGERCAGARISLHVESQGSLPATATNLSDVDQERPPTFGYVLAFALLLLAGTLIGRRFTS
jgi:hypothetical protein